MSKPMHSVTIAIGRIALLFLGSGATAAAAQPVVAIDPPAQSVVVGDSVAVTVVVSGLGAGVAPSIGAFDIDVTFDPWRLRLVDVDGSDELGDPQIGEASRGSSSTQNEVNAYAVSLLPVASLDARQSSSVVLITLHFEAKAPGAAALVVSANALGDAFGEPLPAAFENGAITISSGPVIAPAASSAGILITVVLLFGTGLFSLIRSRRCATLAVALFGLAVATPARALALPGDADVDGDVDLDDFSLVLAARSEAASGPDDPRDLDGDGTITVLDARQLVLLCTHLSCAVIDTPTPTPTATDTPTATATPTATPSATSTPTPTATDTPVSILELAGVIPDASDAGFLIAGGDDTSMENFAGDWAGYSVAVLGDLDGDGLAEVGVGAPRADPDGATHRGSAYIVRGKVDGGAVDLADVLANNGGFGLVGKSGGYNLPALLCNGTWSPCGATGEIGDNRAWTDGPVGDGLGFDIEPAGDVNGDGRADLIVSAPYAYAGQTYRGKSYVVFGAAAQGTTGVDSFESTADPNGFVIAGEEGADHARPYTNIGFANEPQGGDLAGWNVDSLRDFNGDGLADLLVGARNAPRDNRGHAYVVLGKADGLPVQLSDVADESNAAGILMSGTRELLRLGWGDALSDAGDFNRDGRTDLLLHPNYLSSTNSFIVLGTTATTNVALDNFAAYDVVQIEHPAFSVFSNPFRVSGNMVAGFAVAGGGDVNGDGFADVLMAGRSEDASASFFVVLGTDAETVDMQGIPAGTGGFRLISNSFSTMNGLNSPIWKNGLANAGDVNGDGLDDMLIADSTARVDGGDQTGRIYVVYGKTDTAAVDLDNLAANSAGFVINGVVAGDRAGFSVDNGGDVNGDGLADIVIGAIGGDASGHTDAGEVYVVYGANFSNAITGIGTTGDDVLTGTPGADSLVGGLGDDQLLGMGGADVLYGGAGDDLLQIGDTNFRRVRGGSGFDTLQLGGDGTALVLSDVRGKVDEIEAIDLSLPGSQSVELTRLDILNLSPTSNEVVVFGESTAAELVADGFDVDVVDLSDDNWRFIGNVTIDGRSFREHRNGRAVAFIESSLVLRVSPSIADQSFRVAENSPNGTVVGTIVATDTDGTVDDYSIVAPSGFDAFSVDSISGEVSVLDATQLDYETTPVFTFDVRVTDNDGRTGTATVTIELGDVNEKPVLTGFDGSATVPEHAATATIVATAQSVDPDAGDSPSYAIVGGDPEGIFAIDPDTGVVTVANGACLDYESQASVTIDIRVTDEGGLADTAALSITVEDVTDLVVEDSVTFVAEGRDLFSADGAFVFDVPAQVAELSVPAGDATSVGSFSLDLGGDFTLRSDIDVTTGSLDVRLPFAVTLGFPDEVVPGASFTMTSGFLLDNGATLSGYTPGYSLKVAATVENLVATGSWDGASSAVELFDQSYSMDPNSPFELEQTSNPVPFSGSVTGSNTLGLAAPVVTELYDAVVDWDSYLQQALTLLGLPSNEGTFTCTTACSSLGFTAVVDYIIYSWDILGNVTMTQDFALTVDGVDATVTFENGSTVSIPLGSDVEITLPLGADVDGDGKVGYSATFAVRTSFENDTKTAISLGKHLTAGEFKTTVQSLFGGAPVVSQTGPLLDQTLQMTFAQDDDFDFSLTGWSGPSVSGAIDLAN